MNLDKIFKLSEHGTNVRTELIAGLTSFVAMAYIVVVNPTILSTTGMDFRAVMIVTCLGAALGCFLTAALANVPFCQAPGMGVLAFFAYTLCGAMGYTWQQALAVVFLSGVIFFIITITPVQNMIVEAIPLDMKNAISAGIGLFVALVGLFNAGVVETTESGGLTMGNLTSGAPLVAVIGLAVAAILMVWNVKGGMIIAILVATIVAIPLGVTQLPESFSLGGLSIAPIFMKLSFDFSSVGILSVISVVITLAVYNTFDTMGTLIATATNAGMVDENGNMPGCNKAMMADAASTMAAGLMGTSTVNTLVESSTGIAAGGRTGLTAVFCGLLFLASIFLAPIVEIIPAAATTSALIMAGTMMAASLKNINWKDMEVAIPCFLTVAIMPFAYSISDGIGFGFISYVLIKIFRGKAKEVSPVLYVLSVIFIAYFIISAAF